MLAVRGQTVKTCSECGHEKPIDAFRKDGRGGYGPACKDCFNVRRRERYADNPKLVLSTNKKWAAENKEHINTYRKSWSRKGYVHYRSARRLKEIANLSDSYVRQVIVGDSRLSHKDIPQVMVDIHREVLRIKRATRNEKRS